MPFRKSNLFKTSRISIIAVLIALIVSLTALTGWFLHLYPLTSFRSGWVSMKFNTALATILSGISFFLLTRNFKIPGRFLALIVFLLGMVSLSEYLLEWNALIDELFYSDWINYSHFPAGRMSPVTAVSIILLAISLLTLSCLKKVCSNISALTSVLTFLISLLAFVNYIYGGHIQPFHQPGFIEISFPAAVSLLLLSTGILFTNPGNGILAAFHKKTLAARTGWRSILISILLLFLFSWLQIQGIYANLYDAEFGTVLMFLSFSATIFFIILRSTIRLNLAEKEKEKLYLQKEENEKRLNEAQHLAHVGSWELDLLNNKLIWSAETYNIFELSSQQFVPTYDSFLSFIHPEDREMVNKAYKDSVKNKSVYHITHRLQFSDGRIKIIEEHCETFYDKMSNPYRSVGIIQDITEKEMAEEIIREQTKMFIALVDTAPDATVIVNGQGIIQLANSQAVRLTGYEKEELQGKIVEDLINPSLKEKHRTHRNFYMKDAYTRQMGSSNDLTIIRKDGTEIPVEISLAPFHSKEGLLITASIRDITERQRAKQELKNSYNSIRMLSEHLQNVTEQERTRIAREIHDEFGQQLIVMKLDISWLYEKIATTHDAARERLQGLKLLIDQMVAGIRRLAFELRPSILDDMGLGAAIEVQLSEIKKKSNIYIRFNQPPEELYMPDTIKSSLFRIVQESLTNIVRYAGAKHITIDLYKMADQLHLSIKDDGIGFDPDLQDGKKTLGLLGMRERTMIMGGSFKLESATGKGTIIHISIPLS